MAYWSDDYHLVLEQRRLDAAQEDARRKIEARRKIMVERETNQIVSGHHRAVVLQATIGGVPESCIAWV
jgi:hypothetical protein